MSLSMEWIILAGILVITILLLYLSFKLRAWFLHLDGKIERLFGRMQGNIKLDLETQLNERTLEVQHTIALQKLDLKFPVFIGGWSIDSFLAKFLINHLLEFQPNTILELGSGSSSILIAKTMEILNKKYEHFAIDHEKRFLDLSKQYAKLNGVADKIQFLECPLGEVEGIEGVWYKGLKNQFGGKQIDLLIVDGPPAGVQKHARYPALSMLYPYLSQNCTVILDDTCREDEKEIALKWADEFPEFNLEFLNGGHGAACLTRRKDQNLI